MTTLASIEFCLAWESEEARHTDCYLGQKVNFWRDFLPPEIEAGLQAKTVDNQAGQVYPPGEILPAFEPSLIKNLRPEQFDRHFVRGLTLNPRRGRFYPVGILKDLPGYFRENRNPCRCLEADEDRLRFDLNHPLAGRKVKFGARIQEVWDSGKEERGGRSMDWVENSAAEGPGLQARHPGLETDFSSDNPYSRLSEMADIEFYCMPRLVDHLDSHALDVVSALYGRLVPPGGRVLDLMSSWKSHLPRGLDLEKVTGLGMNEEELSRNDMLGSRVVHDLNAQPQMPFADESFDAVICTVSVEYLVHPVAVFQDVARVLKPNGLFILTFSNRWFPPKVIKLWPELHEFERMGLVLDYFLRSERFQHLETYSLRGYPRPEDDPHAATTPLSDPVFAVWGRKKE